MRILFLTTILLSKKRNGGEVASQCFIDALQQIGHEVTVVGYLRKGDSLEQHPTHNVIVVDERYTETRKSKRNLLLWYTLSFLQNLPYSSAKYFAKAYKTLVQQQLQTHTYDLVIIDHAQMGWLLNCIPDGCPIVTIAHNVEQQIYQESSQSTANPIARWVYQREAKLIGRIEQQLAISAQQIWTLTENDAHYFAKMTGTNKSKVFGIPPRSTDPTPAHLSKSFDIALLGSWDWAANDETLRWFLRAIYPQLPTDLSIQVAGKGADWIVGQYPNLHYQGVVPDAQSFLAQAKVIAIPTLRGGGIQIKTLDAIASGSQIVATPIALRGIAHPPKTVTVAKDAGIFAACLTEKVQMETTNASQEAKTWYHNRQQQFLRDIQAAVIELDEPYQISSISEKEQA